MHNVFISYHHKNDQAYKEAILAMNKARPMFVDWSVDTGDISDDLNDETIRVKIRDEYLRTSSVTIVLVGTETRRRKHIDWEIMSSMIDGPVNKKSGIVVIMLPSVNCEYFTAGHDGEKALYPANTVWVDKLARDEYMQRYPYMPDRLLDNLARTDVRLSVVPWKYVENRPDVLAKVIEGAYKDRVACVYDTSRPMRRHDS